MFKAPVLRQAARTAITATRPRASVVSRTRLRSSRLFSASGRLCKDDKDSSASEDQYHDATTAGEPGASGLHEGQFSRTDNTVEVKYPEEKDLPRSTPVQGRGGPHFKRTLASFSLDGKTAVVTGGARGLGLVMAQALAESGADVALVDLNKEEAQNSAEALMETFRRENPYSESYKYSQLDLRPPIITAHYSDVADPQSVDECLKEIVHKHGKIDNLVTSAGFTENFDAIAYPYDRMKKLWGVNVDGTYLWSTGVAKHLMAREAQGSIVFIGSMSGAIVNVPQPQAPYNAAKAAVRHLAASLAVEWAHAGIRVNCISPGYMLTALTKKILDDNPALAKHWTSLIPVGKMGRPEDLMGAVTFLSSDASKYVTGADLRVDGGYTVT
ncbi:gb [Venturia nashicola]|nr:gb [Venturia nashicola]